LGRRPWLLPDAPFAIEGDDSACSPTPSDAKFAEVHGREGACFGRRLTSVKIDTSFVEGSIASLIRQIGLPRCWYNLAPRDVSSPLETAMKAMLFNRVY
jgi:hypothetical protein